MSSKHFDRNVAAMLSAISLLGTCLSSGVTAVEPTPIDGKINWVYDYKEGQRLSKASGKPMFIVFRCER